LGAAFAQGNIQITPCQPLDKNSLILNKAFDKAINIVYSMPHIQDGCGDQTDYNTTNVQCKPIMKEIEPGR